MLDYFGGPLERSDLADAGNIFAIPFDPELEVLIGIEAQRIDAELCHGASLGLDLPSDLLEFDDDEFGRLERRETDEDIDDATIDVVLRGGFPVALHEVSFPRCLPLEGTLPEKTIHEGAHVKADLRPERLIVRFEDYPFQPLI